MFLFTSRQFVREVIRGIPNGGWSLPPRLVSAACRGLILVTQRGPPLVPPPWARRARSQRWRRDLLVYSSTVGSFTSTVFVFVFMFPKFRHLKLPG